MNLWEEIAKMRDKWLDQFKPIEVIVMDKDIEVARINISTEDQIKQLKEDLRQ